MDIPEADHDLYYRVLMSINVGDRIRWKLRPERPDLDWYYGTVTKMYPRGNSEGAGKDSAYMMVTPEMFPDNIKAPWKATGMAVHFDNPTIEKMHPMEPTDMTKLETDQ